MKKDVMDEFKEYVEMREHALDFIDTYSNQEIAQLVRERILTVEEVEDRLKTVVRQ